MTHEVPTSTASEASSIQPNSQILEVPKRSPLLFVFSLVLVGVTVAAALYLSLSKSAIQAAQSTLDGDIAALSNQITDLKSQKVEATQSARAYLDQIEKNEIHWSKVIKSVKDLVPVDPTTQQNKIRFLSYSGSTGGNLSLNAETVSAVDPPFTDVAQLVNVFNSSSFFRDGYVPSITRGLSSSGAALLSFTFNVVYHESLPTDTSNIDSKIDAKAEDAKAKVPRK